MAKLILKTTGTGQVKMEAEGFQGPTCEKTINAFVTRMGSSVAESEPLPEYYNAVPETGLQGEQF